MMMIREAATATLTAFVLALTAASAAAKDEVKVGFIGPLTGGVSSTASAAATRPIWR